MKFFIVLKIFDFKIIFFECVIFYMEVILINKKRFKKKIIDIILKVVESINFLIIFWFFFILGCR